MTDIRNTAADGLRTQFANNAKLPQSHIADAEQFLTSLKQTVQSGQAPSAKTLENGHKILNSLQNSTEVFAYNATILASQEAAGDQELDARLKSISTGVEQAERTTTRLRQTLEAYGR